MSTNTTLFSHIVPLYGKTELIATEALRYILQQSEPARNALENLLRSVGSELGSLSRFQTEASGDEGERVDLVCYDEHGTERVLIEAKFWAGLTDNQPNTYLARLPEDAHAALLFLAPAQRIDTLWQVLCRRAEEQHNLSVTSDTPASGELRSVSIDSNGHKMLVTSWRAVLRQMESRADNAGDLKTVCDIRQLIGLTERRSSEAGLCLCGCGGVILPTSRYVNGHFPKVRDTLQRVQQAAWRRAHGSVQDVEIADEDLLLLTYLVERVRAGLRVKVGGYSTSRILKMAEELGLGET